jgi:hypothetical protein
MLQNTATRKSLTGFIDTVCPGIAVFGRKKGEPENEKGRPEDRPFKED